MLMNRKKDKMRQIAVQRWKTWCAELEHAVRVKVLHIDAVNKTVLS